MDRDKLKAMLKHYEEWTCCDLCMFSVDCKTNRTDCKKAEISKIKQQAEARLKEKKE